MNENQRVFAQGHMNNCSGCDGKLSADGKSWYEDKDTSNGFNGESDSGKVWESELGGEFMASGMADGMNSHYKKYVSWFKLAYPGQSPLTFKQWLHWAQNKGFAKRHRNARGFDGGHWAADAHADEKLSGDKTPMPEDKKDIAMTTGSKVKSEETRKKMKKIMAISLVSVMAIALVVAASTGGSK